MPLDNWGTPLRDVLADADIRLELGELNPKLTGFFASDGQKYQRPYQEIAERIGEQITENRIETWKKLFQELGLLRVDDGILHLTRFGRVVSNAYGEVRQGADEQRMRIAAAAVRVLGRQQLLNPTTLNRDYPKNCNVLPYRALWRAIHKLGALHWEELHRVLLRVMRQEDVDAAITRIAEARQNADYDPQKQASADHYLGPAVYGDADQATRRMTPWFSAGGFGGLLIEREPTNGRRAFTPLGSLLIPEELAEEREWTDFGTDQKAWFAYLDKAVDSQTEVDSSADTASQLLTSALKEDDPIFLQVQKLLTLDNASGILLVGPPGTGKSWYAREIAIKLTNGNSQHIREVQFHPSYQYEDFVEGYTPDSNKGFRLVDRHLLEMAAIATGTDSPVVLVIDEFSRVDPSRVLGETMTYMESSLRGIEFYLPSGRKASIPPNLVFLATMNPHDRSVDEIDDAMDRRWSKVTLRPDGDKLKEFLTKNGVAGHLVGTIFEFFTGLQNHLEIGHAFFRSVTGRDSLVRLWNAQLSHLVEKRLRFNADSLRDVEGMWAKCLASIEDDRPEPAEKGDDTTSEKTDAPAT